MSEDAGLGPNAHICFPRGVLRPYCWGLCSCCGPEFRNLYSDPGWMAFTEKVVALKEMREAGHEHHSTYVLPDHYLETDAIFQVIQHQSQKRREAEDHVRLLEQQVKYLTALAAPKEPDGTIDDQPWHG